MKKQNKSKSEAKFKDGQQVIAGCNYVFIVVESRELLKGRRYKLAFPKSDGTIDERRLEWHFWEHEITASKRKQMIKGSPEYVQDNRQRASSRYHRLKSKVNPIA